MIINSKQVKNWKEVVMAYIRV